MTVLACVIYMILNKLHVVTMVHILSLQHRHEIFFKLINRKIRCIIFLDECH